MLHVPASAPRPSRRPQVRDRHGRTATDNYAWLLDPERTDPDVLAHLEAENAYVADVLTPTAALQASLFEEIKARIQETDQSVPTYHDGYWYFSRSIEGAQYPVFCRVAAIPGVTDPPDADSAEVVAAQQVLLDGNLEAGDHDYFGIGIFDLSHDGTVLAWGVDHNGSEQYTIRFRNLPADGGPGVDRATVITGAYYSSAWSADGNDFFYTRPDDAMRPAEIWRHRLGTDPADDALVYREDDERFFCSIGTTKDGLWLVLDLGSKITGEIRVCPADDVDAGFAVVVPRRDGVEASIEHVDGTFYVLTNDGALDFRVVSTPTSAIGPAADPSAWTDVVPHVAGVRIEAIDVLRDHLLIQERAEATTRLRLHRISTGEQSLVDQPEAVSTVGLGANDDLDWPLIRFGYTSLITPSTVVDLDLTTGERVVRKVQPVLGGYDPANYVTSRLWATADDGVQVPISVVHRRDRTPGGPTLLYGYGSYEISIDPSFSSLRLSLLDRGWAFAIGHIRGGGEMGRNWYLDGKMEAKPNTFDDFIACGHALIDAGIASPGSIAIRGGSAGGLLVGAALNRAPELWSAVVAEVPFVDALNTILDPTLPLTVIEWEEWGNPVDSVDIFDLMGSYSPYENIPAAASLPPVLATGGLHDPRVGYWEPAKWIARLRDEATGGPFLCKTELGAGHGGPSGRYDAWKDEAMVFAFLLSVLGPDDGGGESPPEG